MPITEGGRFTPNDRIISPGVFTREIDQSGLAQGVADIGAVVVAPFAKGPGFSPTLCRTVADLEQRFGVADGTLYGPYTAKQYLQEKGFVTVCRVGALTGYRQKYPWVIWAENGGWKRSEDAGWLNPTSSWIDFSNVEYTYEASANVDPENESAGINLSGSFEFKDAPVVVTLVSGREKAVEVWNEGAQKWDNADIAGPVPNSGSRLYAGQSIMGFISGVFEFSKSINIPAIDATDASKVIDGLFEAQKFVGNLKLFSEEGKNFKTYESPFDLTGNFGKAMQISQSVDECNNRVLHIFSFLSGEIGTYEDEFRSGSLKYDHCTKTWSGSDAEYKVLAVLADTRFGGMHGLDAPGFNGSTQTYSDSIDGAAEINHTFNLQLSQSEDGGYGTYQFSLDKNDPQYITNVFGKDPTAGNKKNYAAGTKKEAAYIYKIFEDSIAEVAANPSKWRVHGTALPSGSWKGEPMNFTDEFSNDLLNGDSEFSLTNASTPWIISQQISPWNGGEPTRFPLFKIWTLSDGTYTNKQFKIEISNVRLAGTVAGSEWGTFTLTVRDYSDTDKRPKIIEQFNNLSMDPNSANFIARRIGDRYNYIRFDGKIIEFGTYANLSKNIRIEMSPNPYPITAVPYGFQAYIAPINGAIGTWCAPVAYSKASVYGLFPGKYPSGVDFGGIPAGADIELASLYPTSSEGQGCWRNNLQYNCPIPAESTVGRNSIFALDLHIDKNGVATGSYEGLEGTNAIPAILDEANETTYVKMRKFVFGFQGGFDGQSPAIPINIGKDIEPGNTQGLDCTNSNTAGSIAYKQCIGALSNADEFDINLIVTPGIIYSYHPYVTNLVIDMCEHRGDCFYILDIYKDNGVPAAGQIDEVVGLAREFDTSYAGTYYPWIKIKDTNINQIVTVPPSVVMPAVYAANDRVAGEWWAAAGLNRGGITQAVQVTDRTTHIERDALYEGRVNPIAAFPGTGGSSIVAWGQKTLQVQASALDRINVRRLLIEIKKFFASTAKYLVFEQNTATTRNKFLAIVNPYLESIQQRSGLYAFQVVMDASNNTPDIIDRNMLYGQIYLKPTKTAEFIVLDFNIMPTGASFPTA